MVSTGIWVTTSLLKSPKLFLVFLPISTMLSFGWSPLVLLFPSLPVTVPIFWWLYRARQLQLVPPSLSCSIFFQFSCKVIVLISLFPFLQFYLVVSRKSKVHNSAGFLFSWLSLGLIVWTRLDDPFVFQSPKEFCLIFLDGFWVVHIPFVRKV